MSLLFFVVELLFVEVKVFKSAFLFLLTEPFQNMKPVQSVAVGGVAGSQFKTIIPLATQPNVQQIQVPGSRFHYVRLVTATTASSTGQPSGPSTSSIQTGEFSLTHLATKPQGTCCLAKAPVKAHLWQLIMMNIPQLNLWWSVREQWGCRSRSSQHRP